MTEAVQPNDQHKLDRIAHDLEIADPALARRLSIPAPSTSPAGPPRADRYLGGRDRLDALLRRTVLVVAWMIGVGLGVVLLTVGTIDHAVLLTVSGALATGAAGAAVGATAARVNR